MTNQIVDYQTVKLTKIIYEVQKAGDDITP